MCDGRPPTVSERQARSTTGSLVPAEDTQRPQRVPPARPAVAVVQLEIDVPGWVFQQPRAVRPLLRSQHLVASSTRRPAGRRPPGSTPGRAARRSASGSGTRTRSQIGLTTSPVLLRRNSGRSSRYSSPPASRRDGSAEPPVARSYASSPSRTLMVVWNDDRTEPCSASQFHPPSSSCSPRRRSTMPSTSWPKYTPRATVLPLMHGSTSPSKNGRSSYSQRQFSLTCATARRTRSLSGSTPKVAQQGERGLRGGPGLARLFWAPSRPRGKSAPPAHWPSSPCRASSRAPHPSVATRARSAATTSAGASVRSRSTCQRMAGSESSSQSSTVTAGV